MATVNHNFLRSMMSPALSLLLLAIASSAVAFGPQSSNKAQEWGFDFVEEFDGLQDWNGSVVGRVGNQYAAAGATQLSRMPKLANGGTSAWGYYSLWGEGNVSPHSWIGGTEGGLRKVWRGTKSASIDIGDTANGPSRLGIHFDDYNDLSVFYMVNIPKNNFPTSCTGNGCSSGGIGTYSEGSSYAYYASWKFATFNIGCDVLCEGDGYGKHWTLPHIKQYNYGPNGLILQVVNGHNSNTGLAYGTNSGETLDQFMGGWFGVEYRLRKNLDGTTYQMDVWIYSPQGEVQHVVQNTQFSIRAEAAGLGWDQFFFGGNNSGSWVWGPTMVSHYYVDDFIIDAGSKGRIGPRYFNAIGVQNNALPSPAPGLTATPRPR